MRWVDLSGYGAELKRVNLPDGTSFPVLAITDVAKYNQSGAMPLKELDAPNNSNFERLPGGRKGRNPAVPLYLMTNSVQAGSDGYKIRSGLAKLLNVSEEKVTSLFTEMPDNQIASASPLADMQRFSSIINQTTQKLFNKTLYVVKPTGAETNLIDLASTMSANQHGLFPKNNISNIPFSTLDKLGHTSSIVDRAFLSPDAALKAGFPLSSLDVVRLQGDRAVLPVSLNKDNSVNVILNMNRVSGLAYSNFEWTKNLPMIADVLSLNNTREQTRSILNANASTIKTDQDMDSHLSKISVALQNFNTMNRAPATHKPVKFQNPSEASYLVKNRDDQWRYVEKTATSKIDEPLNWTNYSKIITRLANNNATLSAALELSSPQGEQIDAALNKVFGAQQNIFNKFIPEAPEVSMKIHHATFDKGVREFSREVESLDQQRIAQTLAALSAVPNVGAIENTIGDPQTDLNDFRTVTSNTPADDSIARPPLVEVAKLSTLPRGISDAVDKNYDEINPIYQARQSIGLNNIPYREEQLANATVAHENAVANDMRSERDQLVDILLESERPILRAPAPALVEATAQAMEVASNELAVDQIKVNILEYQINKHLGNVDSNLLGTLVLNSDANGNYVPFNSAADQAMSAKLLENNYALINEAAGELQVGDTEVESKLDAFVEKNYTPTSAALDNPDRFYGEALDNAGLSESEMAQARARTGLKPDFAASFESDLALNAGFGLRMYVETGSTESLDDALISVSQVIKDVQRQTGKFPLLETSESTQKIVDDYAVMSSTTHRLSWHQQPTDPVTNIQLSDIQKINLLKELALPSLKLASYGLEKSALTDVMRHAEKIATRKLDISKFAVTHLNTEFAGQYLVINASKPEFAPDVLESNQAYGYSANSTPPYKLQAVDKTAKDLPENLSSNNYDQALRDGFATYQLNSTAAFIGLDAASIARSVELASALSSGSDVDVQAVTLKNFGTAMSQDDIKNLTATSGDGFTNAAYTALQLNGSPLPLTTDEVVSYTQEIQVAAKLSGITTAIPSHPLIANLNSFDEYEQVKDYLTVKAPEKSAILAVNWDYGDLSGSARRMIPLLAECAADAEAAGRNEQRLPFDLGDVPRDFSVMTTIPQTPTDAVTARIIPASWINAAVSSTTNNVNHTLLSIQHGTVDVETIKNALTDHFSPGLLSLPVLSIPVKNPLDDAALAPTILSASQRYLLKEGGAAFVDAGVHAHANEIMTTASLASLNVALSNAHPNIQSDVNRRIVSPNEFPSQTKNIRVAISSPTNELELPEIKFQRIGDQLPPNFKPLADISIVQLMDMLPARIKNPIDFSNPVELQMTKDFELSQMVDLYYKGRDEIGFNVDRYAATATEKLTNELHNVNQRDLRQTAETAIDALPVVSVSVNALLDDPSSTLLLLRQSLIDQLPVSQPSSVSNQINYSTLDRADLYARQSTDGKGDVHLQFGFAASLNHGRELEDAGFEQIYPANVPIGSVVKNPLALLASGESSINDVLSVITFEKSNDRYDPESMATVSMLSLVEPKRATEIIKESRAAMDDFIASNAPPKKTVDVLLHTYDAHQLSQMTDASIADKVNLGAMWGANHITSHIKDSPQNLDAIILSKMLRDSLPAKPVVAADDMLVNAATGYAHFIKGAYTAISQSTTPTALLNNFGKMAEQTTRISPEFFTSHNSPVLSVFKSAAHISNTNGGDAGAAFTQALEAAKPSTREAFVNSFNDVVATIAKKEQLFTGEKSFVNSMDGVVLNVGADKAQQLSDDLRQRISTTPRATTLDTAAYEGGKSLLTPDTAAIIASKSTVDYNSQQTTENLSNKWGVALKLLHPDNIYEQGYTKFVDNMMTKLHTDLSEKSAMPDSALKLSGLTVGIGARLRPVIDVDIHLKDISGGVDAQYPVFAKAWTTSLYKSVVTAEINALDTKDAAQFIASKKGLVEFLGESGIPTKTQAAAMLVDIHNKLKDGFGDVDASALLRDRLKSVAAQKAEVFAEHTADIHAVSDQYTANFAKNFVDKTIAKQEVALSAIEGKIKSLAPDVKVSGDLYEFSSQSDKLDKVVNVALPASKSVIDKFVADNYDSESKAVKAMIATTISDSIANNAPVWTAAQELLAASATDKFIQMVDAHTAAEVKQGVDYLPQLNQYFGSVLAGQMNIDDVAYKSDFGQQWEMEERSQHAADHANGKSAPEYNPSPDDAVVDYLKAVVSDEVRHPTERDLGSEKLAAIIVTHSSESESQLKVQNNPEIDNDHKKNASLEL